MIRTFKSKALEKFFNEGVIKGIPQEFEKRIRVRLNVIDSATNIDDIKLPSYNLHELQGNREGTWSIKVSGNWRITFRFEENDAYDIDLEDYH
jgi:proteic killer suppression protein